MNVGGGTMLHGNMLSSAKGSPANANEQPFTERNEATDAPRSFSEAKNNIGILVLQGNAREDLLDSMPEIKPLTHRHKFSSVVRTAVPVESTYTNTRSLLEFNIELHTGTYTVPANMGLTLPIRFQNKTTENFIKITQYLPVNNFFGCFIALNLFQYLKETIKQNSVPLYLQDI